MSKKIRKKRLKIYKAYLYGTVEEFVMFTLIYFNRSQHTFAFLGIFKGIYPCIWYSEFQGVV